MSSGDVWHEDEETKNADDLEALLGLSVELVDTMNKAQREVDMEAAKARHPSSQPGPSALDGVTRPGAAVLTAADRCDHCSASAVYRVADGKAQNRVLDFCLHAFRKHFPPMVAQGWAVIGGNPELLQVLGQTEGDHA